MIRAVELGDFLSHSETRLEFENGVTVFVGPNGAGKSSIIDAITFALFGQHTRKTNKGLIKRGAAQGFAKVEFSVNNRQFEAVRKIDGKGSLAAKFSETVNEQQIEIAAGERKQFGESMTSEIEKTIGLDFEKLKIASIVQQGEINAIIDAKPKEFKEMLNAIIGINKLDTASESMKIVIREFRETIRSKIGYDDTHVEILARDIEHSKKEISDAKPEMSLLLTKQREMQQEISAIRKKIETDTPKIDKINQLESRKNELQAYAKNAVHEIQNEINKNERKIRDCEGCFEYAGKKSDLEAKVQKTEQAIEEAVKKTQEITSQSASLREKLTLASKLQLRDNRCPVCDSNVEKLNPLFQEEHIKKEMGELQQKLISKKKEIDMYSQKKREFLAKLENLRDAEATLRAYSISKKEEIEHIKKETEVKRGKIKKIPMSTNSDLEEMGDIDSHSKTIFDEILKLESETRDFDEREFFNLKIDANRKQSELSHIDQSIGGLKEKVSKAEEQVSTIEKIISELKIVKEYMVNLDEIQNYVFSRDGPVATSLRSWALNSISAKASEYLALLNTKIQRVMLSEKTRDVSILCYSRNEVLELESLSGGEKVSVAIALRLGMSSLLGASNLNLMILDEPTTHLDAERKKSLVGVLSQLADISRSETPMQFLIITHDAEIFDDSTVEQIYKFESSDNGSQVTAL